jgi:hypothetical protein
MRVVTWRRFQRRRRLIVALRPTVDETTSETSMRVRSANGHRPDVAVGCLLHEDVSHKSTAIDRWCCIEGGSLIS